MVQVCIVILRLNYWTKLMNMLIHLTTILLESSVSELLIRSQRTREHWRHLALLNYSLVTVNKPDTYSLHTVSNCSRMCTSYIIADCHSSPCYAGLTLVIFYFWNFSFFCLCVNRIFSTIDSLLCPQDWLVSYLTYCQIFCSAVFCFSFIWTKFTLFVQAVESAGKSLNLKS